MRVARRSCEPRTHRRSQSFARAACMSCVRFVLSTDLHLPRSTLASAVNTRRLIGLIAVALFAAWLGLRGCTREPEPPPPPPEPVREEFHAARALRATVSAEASADSQGDDVAWIERELRYLLLRGQMRVTSSEAPSAFELRLKIDAANTQGMLELVAPDGVIERKQPIEMGASRLEIAQALAKTLPTFLDASHASGEWSRYLGTQDARAYETYLRAAQELLGPTSQGVTRPTASRARTRTVERLEALTRAQPKFARAWAALAIAYLSVGGADLDSLTDLAESAAERAIVLDDALAEAYAALGIVDLRRHEWIAAEERLQRALAMDALLASAAEGLACLYADSGHAKRSLKHAELAVSLQPRNAGANECLTYAKIATGADVFAEDFVPVSSSVRVQALAAFLQGDTRGADRLLRRTIPRAEFEIWAGPTLQAAANRRLVPEAMKAITQAANDGYIDASTEILCGAALKQPEFVFNRIARLAREESAAPLRVFWLPNADFLRKHPRFEDAMSEAGLFAFWHSSGAPDICESEPDVYGCNVKPRNAETRE